MLTLSRRATAGGLNHTENRMHEKPERSDWWLMNGLPFTMNAHTHAHTATTSTSGTHSDVQTHIPQVGSWSWVRICEICQPMGDWVIEEFDSERNILLPWWWTRGNNTRIQQHWGLAGEKKRRLIINRGEQGNNNRIYSRRFEGNFWIHLYRGHSSPETHPGPSSLRPRAPSRCCAKFAPDAAAGSLQTVEERRSVWDMRILTLRVSRQNKIKSYANTEIKLGLWNLVIHARTNHTHRLFV